MNNINDHIESTVNERTKRVRRHRLVSAGALVALVATFVLLAPLAFTLSNSDDAANAGIILQQGTSSALLEAEQADSADASSVEGDSNETMAIGAPSRMQPADPVDVVANELEEQPIASDEPADDLDDAETALEEEPTTVSDVNNEEPQLSDDEIRALVYGLDPEIAKTVVYDEEDDVAPVSLPDPVGFFKKLFAAPRKAPAGVDNALAQGTTGEVNWAVTENEAGEQVLTIYGSGAMDQVYDVEVKYISGVGDYGSTTILADERPWAAYAQTVKHIVIEEGVTAVGRNAFRAMNEVLDLSLPDSLETINGYAFAACSKVTSLTIPENAALGSSSAQWAFAFMNLSELYLPAKFANSMTGHCYTFDGNRSLSKIEYGEGSTTLNTNAFRDLKSIDELVFPSSMNKVSAGLSPTDMLHRLYFNAKSLASSEFYNPTLWYSSTSEPGLRVNRELTIGPDVELLPRAVLDSMANGGGLLDVRFEGGNYFESEDMSSALNLREPFTLFNGGTYYADKAGIVYKIENGEAKLVYVDPFNNTVTVPAAIQGPDGQSVPVTGVGRHAIALARKLKTLKFDDPGAITKIDSGAFADCPMLTKVNDQSALSAAMASFPDATCTVLDFENTGLDKSEVAGAGDVGEEIMAEKHLKVSVSVRENSKHEPTSDDSSYYFYTGEAATLTIEVSNPDNRAQGEVARVYISMSNSHGGLSYEPGEHVFTIGNNEYLVKVFETDVPNTYCFEIPTPSEGDTISITPTMSFPSPNSPGGTAKVWVDILDDSERKQLESAGLGNTCLVPMTVTTASGKTGMYRQLVQWVTQRDSFPLDKVVTSGTTAKIEGIADTDTVSVKGLNFTITTAREEDTIEGIGKDYVRRQTYTDTFTLPEGLTWSNQFKEALNSNKLQWSSGGAYFSDADNTSHRYLEFSDDMRYTAPEIWLTDDDKLVVRWVKTNRPTSVANDHETEKHTFRYVVGSDVVEVADPASLESGKTFTIKNQVNVVQEYSYSDPIEQVATAEVSVVATDPQLEFFKTSVLSPYYFGNDATYSLSLRNTGAVSASGESVAFYDQMTYYFYIKPANIEKMFTENDGGHDLKITVFKGLLWGKDGTPGNINLGNAVTTVDGTSGHVLSAELYDGVEFSNDKYNGLKKRDTLLELTDKAQLVYSYDATNNWINIDVAGIEGVIEPCTLTVGPGGDFDSVEAALASIGFAVGYLTTYRVEWEGNESFTLASNQKYERIIEATAKDSFMLLHEDIEERYNRSITNGKVSTSNSATAKVGGMDKAFTAAVRTISLYRDFDFDKSSSINGESLVKENIGDGAIVDYRVTWSHTGQASYDALPVVDHMQTGQALLVPVDRNEGLADMQLTQVEVENVSYYVLDRPGTYHNVRVGESADGSEHYLADTVSIRALENGGWDTVVKWYFHIERPELYWEKTSAVIHLKSLVRLSWGDGDKGEEGTPTIAVNNEAYLGDHIGHRLWEHVGSPFHRYKIRKSVLEEMGDEADPSDDRVASNSVLYEGQDVTYRLDFFNNSGSIALINAEALSDKLPKSIEGHRWSKENVKVSYVSAGAFGYPQVAGVLDGSEWYLEDDSDDPNQQYLKWNSKASFLAAAGGWGYVYVTLTMPSGKDWDAYCEAYSLTGLDNTMYMFGEDSTVHHDLSVPAKAVIHKGVVKTGSAVYSKEGKIVGATYADSEGLSSRAHYANDDYRNRFVTYYSTIYNDGTSRLYLDNIQDRLPRGFTFYRLGEISTSGYTENSSRTAYVKDNYLYSEGYDRNRGTISYLKHKEVATTQMSSGGYQVVKFEIKHTGDTTTNGIINYDPDTDRCYLLPGQAIELVYTCRTNSSDATDDYATNIVGLEVDSHAASRIEVDDATFQLKNPGAIERNESEACISESASAVATYGFTGEADSNWLVSQVSVERGSILPGVTKMAVKRTSTTGFVEEYPQSAEPQDTITWQVLAENDGSLPLSDYVVTDVMQAPYVFTGEVSYEIFRAGKETSDASFGSSYLFKFAEREVVDGKTRVRIIKPNANAQTWVTIGGDPIKFDTTMRVYTSEGSSRSNYLVGVSIYISMDLDENGNEVLQVRFPDGLQSIPEYGGMGVLTVSTVKPVNDHENKVYYNTSYISPLAQTYNGRKVTRGNDSTCAVTWLDNDTLVSNDNCQSVRNSVPISVAFGYATTAVKTVEQSNNPENKAYSDQPTNSFITLPAKDEEFIYTVLVGNTTELPMDKLVLIDNLPAVGDHSTFVDEITRESQFKVSFAEGFEKDMEVVVTDKNDNRTVLTRDTDYVIEYSKATKFGENDWKGLGNTEAGWSSVADPDESRAFRLRINDPDGTLVPAWSTLSVRFKCRVDDPNAIPGDKAWNSFGYHYRLKGKSNELEAAPLNVGVQFPNIPYLQKALIDRRNKPVETSGDCSFDFIVFKGSPDGLLAEDSGDLTDAKLAQLLEEHGRDYALVKLNVASGQSRSEELLLDGQECYEWQDGSWKPTNKAFEWNTGDDYTVVELPDQLNGKYKGQWFFHSLELGGQASPSAFYTFKYDPTVSQTIVGRNAFDDWDIILKKYGRNSTAEDLAPKSLGGAVFGLYSPAEKDALSDSALTALRSTYGLQAGFDNVLEHEGRSFYLAEIGATTEASSGALMWEGLTQGDYLVVELKAPDGYVGEKEPIYLAKAGTVNHARLQDVYNEVAYDLPMSGGGGTKLFLAVGALLMALAGIAFVVRRHRHHHDAYYG